MASRKPVLATAKAQAPRKAPVKAKTTGKRATAAPTRNPNVREVQTPLTPAPKSNHATTKPALSRTIQKTQAFDPQNFLLSNMFQTDPVFNAIHFKWSDRQQHGRIAYDSMYKHAAAGAPFDTLVAFLKSYRPIFKPAGTSPSDKQKQLAAFANEQLRRLGASGDSRQGYEKLIEWFGQGLKYGFCLAEMVTVVEPWQGQARVQIDSVISMPQASLDSGYNPLEEWGETITSFGDPRYRCFDMDLRGKVTAVHQYFRTGGNMWRVTWTGPEMLSLMHYTHGGTEGNPYGQSLFFTAFYHWGALYTVEQMEDAFMDAGLPYLGISYKTPDGRPSPALHDQVIEVLRQQDPTTRAMILPNATYQSVAASNPAFTDQADKKKHELRAYIRECIFGAQLTSAGAAKELDARNAIQVFFKYFLPSLQREIGTVLTWQFARRLIDANWSNLAQEDYPEVEFQNTLDNDLRVAMPLLQMLVPFIDSDRLGEFMERMVPGFDGTWVPTDHKDSVSEKRQIVDPAANAPGAGPPTKQEGSPDVNTHGQTENAGGSTDTAV